MIYATEIHVIPAAPCTPVKRTKRLADQILAYLGKHDIIGQAIRSITPKEGSPEKALCFLEVPDVLNPRRVEINQSIMPVVSLLESTVDSYAGILIASPQDYWEHADTTGPVGLKRELERKGCYFSEDNLQVIGHQFEPDFVPNEELLARALNAHALRRSLDAYSQIISDRLKEVSEDAEAWDTPRKTISETELEISRVLNKAEPPLEPRIPYRREMH